MGRHRRRCMEKSGLTAEDRGQEDYGRYITATRQGGRRTGTYNRYCSAVRPYVASAYEFMSFISIHFLFFMLGNIIS